MAVFYIQSEYLAISGTDRSALTKNATLAITSTALDTTNMDSAGWVEIIAGLASATLTWDAMDDAAAGSLDEIMWGLFRTKVTFEVRATDSAVGTGNAKYTGTVLINSAGLGGAVGELAMKKYAFPTSGAITRATS